MNFTSSSFLTSRENVVKSKPAWRSNYTAKTYVAYVFGLFLVFCTVVSIILVIFFSRDQNVSTHAPITANAWRKVSDSVKPAVTDTSSDASFLKHIWYEADILTPELLIKGGSNTYEKWASEWRNIDWNVTDLSKGIVIAAGDYHHFTSAYMLIRQLRYHGCSLPIELWHLESELTDDHKACLLPYGVLTRCLDHWIPLTRKHTYSIKVLSIYMSSFTHVLYLDADNNVLQNPEFLFTCKEYVQGGEALFWPDYWPLEIDESGCFTQMTTKSIGKRTMNSYQQESGQMVVNKDRYFGELWAVFRILETGLEGMFPGPFNFGDKDIFHFTWHARQKPYTFIKSRVACIATKFLDVKTQRVQGIAMGQHSPDGTLLFVHQNHAEWTSRHDDTDWWVHVKRHIYDYEGGVEFETWNPIGRTKISPFKAEAGTVEHDYMTFLHNLRSKFWYQQFYSIKGNAFSQNTTLTIINGSQSQNSF